MIIQKLIEKYQVRRVVPLMTGLGGILLCVGIILPKFFPTMLWVDFIAGITMGMSIVFNLFGISLLRWRDVPSESTLSPSPTI